MIRRDPMRTEKFHRKFFGMLPIRHSFVQRIVHKATAHRLYNPAVLGPRQLLNFFLRGIRRQNDRTFPDAAPAEEHLRLKTRFLLAHLGLHVVNRACGCNVGIKAEDHRTSRPPQAAGHDANLPGILTTEEVLSGRIVNYQPLILQRYYRFGILFAARHHSCIVVHREGESECLTM
jgi:hypothetical protein